MNELSLTLGSSPGHKSMTSKLDSQLPELSRETGRRQQGEKRVEGSTANSGRSLGARHTLAPQHCRGAFCGPHSPRGSYPDPHGGCFLALSLFISTLLTWYQTQTFMGERRPFPSLRKK